MAAEPAGLQELRVGKQVTQGKIIAQDDKVCLMLSQDGRMNRVEKTAAASLKHVSRSFQPWSQAIVRDKLKREFGGQFSVSGTRHYLVCARTDRQAKEYGALFEELYVSFQHYFNVRGLKVTEPEFPMVAIVFPDQSSFAQYARQDAALNSSNMVGYYSPQSNRIALFDRGSESTAALEWVTEPSELLPLFQREGEGGGELRACETIATGLVPVVPALLRYANFSRNLVAQKRGNHPGKRGGGSLSQALTSHRLATCIGFADCSQAVGKGEDDSCSERAARI